MHKFFVEPNQIKNEEVMILGNDVNHIKNVLRCVIGEHIEICEKSDRPNKYLAQIADINIEKIQCNILEKIEQSNEPKTKIHIFQGLPKAEKMEIIIQKCTEIGVCAFTPVEMHRSIVKLNDKDVKKKIDRWQKIAETAAKQSGRDIIPKVNYMINIDDFTNLFNNFDLILVAYENEDKFFLKEELHQFNYKNIAILIGPEGGITDEEIIKLKEANAKIISLGRRILRTETAPIVISSIVLYELGDMGE